MGTHGQQSSRVDPPNVGTSPSPCPFFQNLVGDAGSLSGDDAAVETFSSEIVKGVLPSRYAASDVQTGIPYFLRLTAANSLGFGEYGDDVAGAKAAEAPASPGNLSAGVALHVDEVSLRHPFSRGFTSCPLFAGVAQHRTE